MSEEIIFHFDGAIAAQGKLNFYEAARFQYDASRLLVKLDQFRSAGSFVKKITNSSNKQILLQSHQPGSFDISLLAPDVDESDPTFVDAPLSTLLAYVGERVIGKAPNSEIANILNGHAPLVERFGRFESGTSIDDVVTEILADSSLRRRLSRETIELLERRFAELEREATIETHRSQIVRIDDAREQRLISMAAPLLSGMATAFRRSATTLKIISRRAEREREIIFLNREMAAEIGAARIDSEITPIRGDIIQYNKETGWGKIRLNITPTPLSFSVPSDMKSELQSALVAAMRRDSVFVQARFVRDRAGEAIRAFIVGILPDPG